MTHSLPKSWLRYRLILLAALSGAVGCPKDNGTGPAPDYELSLTPAALTIIQGANGNTTVTITRTNFTEAVTLSLGGAPAGVTGSFNPTAPTGTSSTLTVSVGAAVAPGVYTLTVDGSATPGNHSTALTLTVSPPPDYTLSLAPTGLTIVQGTNGNTTVTITRTNFTGAVTLSLGGAPAGVTGAFTPAAPTGTSSTLTVSVGLAVPPGAYNLTVDGTGTAGNRSTPLSLTVDPAPPDYALSLAPAALTIVQGANAPTTVTITRTNFTGAVTLSVGGAPAGVTGSFNPAAPTGTSSTLTLSVGAAVAPGVYNLTVDGTGTPGNRSTPLTLTVQAAPDYVLSLAPTALTIIQGANAPTTVTLTRTNFTGAVTLSLGGAPAGVTGSFNPAAPTGTSSTLTVSVGAAVAPGVYNLTVDGTGTPGNRSTPLTLTVDPVPDYSLSLAPTALTIIQGANAPTTVTITRTNFTGAVTLSLGGAPAGVTGSFNPAAPTGTSSTLTVTVGAAVARGVYNLTVSGTGTAGNRSTPLTLTVEATPDYTLSLAPAALTIIQGANAPTTVTITRTNFTGAVTLSLGGAPAGVTGSFDPAAPTGTASTLTVRVGAAVTPGVYNLTVDGTGTPGNRSTPLALTVQAIPDYSLALTPAALTITPGANAPTTVTITRTNFTGAVTLSLGGAPAGVTGSFDPAAPTGRSSTLTVSVGAAVAPGVYNLTVDGTGTPGNSSTPLTLTVSTTPDYSLSLTPAALTIVQGANAPTTVTITRTNFTGAVTLSLGGAPAGVTGSFDPAAPTGTSSTLTVSVGAAVAPGVYNLTVDGTGTPGNRSTPLTLTVEAVPNYTLSLAPTALTIVQGANAPTTVTITRTNFTGAVTLSLGGAPAGVTGSFNPAAPTGTSSTLTVSVGAAVAPGVYNLTVDGTGTPGNRSTPLTLTVSATANYSLSLTPAALTIAQGANAPTTVTITRTNFTGAVTLSLGGAPVGVTGSFNPTAPTGTSSTLTVTVGAAVTPGVYHLTVDGTGTPGNRSTPLTLTVSSGGGGNVTVDFSSCPVADRAAWVAYQNGTGPWTRVTGLNDVYTFTIGSGGGGLTYVLLGAGNMSSVQVHYMTQAEFTAGTLAFCGPTPPLGKTVTGTAAGIDATQVAQISLGGGTAQASFGALNFTITDVTDGTHDLVGARRPFDFSAGADRAIIRRDQNISNNGDVGTLDFLGAESFATAPATITVSGLVGGETLAHSMSYQVGATCTAAPLNFFTAASASFTAFGIPSVQQRPSDYHNLSISAIIGASDFRSVSAYFHTMADRTLALGGQMPTPALTDLGGMYKRLQAVYMLPAAYTSSTSFSYVDASADKSVSISATFGYSGTAVTLGLADFSALAGWDNNWAPAPASTGDWTVSGAGITGSACTENASLKAASLGGTY